MTLTTLQRDAAQDVLTMLDGIINKATRNEPLSFCELQALRAAATHAAQECAAALELEFEGERCARHDQREWLDMLTYIADPF